MPGWQELHEELQEEKFTVVAVAIDENLDSIIELAKGVTYPVLMDKDHILTELYAISNVPSVLWIDEDGKIVLETTFGKFAFAFEEIDSARIDPTEILDREATERS